MKKLEDIPKNNIFEVPDGYFERLPGVIQTRVAQRNPSPAWMSWSWSLRYALPMLALIAVGIFLLKPASVAPVNVAVELAQIEPEQLGLYLEDHDLTTEDLVETMTWSTRDLNELEKSVFSTYSVSRHEIDRVLDGYKGEL